MIIGSASPRKIPAPPPRGLGAAWILRCPGLSTRPTRGARRIIAHVAATLTTNAAAASEQTATARAAGDTGPTV